MSALPKPELRPSIVQRRTSHTTRPFLDRVVDTMISIHAAKGRGMFAFTAPNRRAGTTHVVELLAEELSRQYHCEVAILPSSTLKRSDPKKLPQGYVERSPNIWVAISDDDLHRMPEHGLEHVWLSSDSRNFDFILVDCPAISAQASALRWTAAADGCFLVVDAGRTKLDQIDRAQNLLISGNGRLEGIVLNRRTYAIPSFIYKFL